MVFGLHDAGNFEEKFWRCFVRMFFKFI